MTQAAQLDMFAASVVAPPVSEPDPLVERLISTGLANNEYLLRLNDPMVTARDDLPSRTFQFPVEFVERDRRDDERSTILLNHPDFASYPFVDEIEAKVGFRPAWEPLDRFGRDRGERWRYYHAIDLSTDAHWRDLIVTRNFTDNKGIALALCFRANYGGLSTKNMRAVLGEVGSKEPDDRSEAYLESSHVKVMVCSGGPMVSLQTRDHRAAWAAVHGLEAKLFKRDRNGHLRFHQRSSHGNNRRRIMTKREELVALADEFDDIAVDADGKCYWCDVANAQTHLRAQLHRFTAQASVAPAEREAKLRDDTIEECARELEQSYPDHAWLNAACAAIRALSSRDDGEAKSSDGGVEGHASSRPLRAGQGIRHPQAGIKPGPSEAPSTIRADVLAMKEALKWALPLADLALEQHRLERVRCGHTDFTFVKSNGAAFVGLTQDEWNKREMAHAAISRIDVLGKTAGEPATIEDRPSGGSIWQAFANLYGNGNIDDEDCAYIDRELVKWRGEKFAASPAPATQQGVPVSVEELAKLACTTVLTEQIRRSGIVAPPYWAYEAIARALLDKYSIRSAMMTEGE